MPRGIQKREAGAPTGLPYIIGNEAAERFSYYGMKAILVVFMTQYLLDAQGAASPMGEPEAKAWFHVFGMANYFFPVLGALLSDILWGKYKTIMRLSVVYCLGHLVLALFETRTGLAFGLMFIAIGSGGIKPCVSAHVGDQFHTGNQHLLEKVFALFYFSINLGAFISTLLTPYLLHRFGPQVAFGIPGILMFIATGVFWLGRRKFVAIPPCGWEAYRTEFSKKETRQGLGKLCIIYLFISIFWSLFDQTGSSWVFQAERMNRTVRIPGMPEFELLAAQIQAANPILVMLLIPAFSWGVYPLLARRMSLTAIRKILIGMFLAAISFLVVGLAEHFIQAGHSVSILWQLVAYVILTAAEVMVSITALEFSYTQAPTKLKSLIMGLFLLSVSLGNGVTAATNFLLLKTDGSSRLSEEMYFYFFAVLMLLTAILFGYFTRHYKERRFLQDHTQY